MLSSASIRDCLRMYRPFLASECLSSVKEMLLKTADPFIGALVIRYYLTTPIEFLFRLLYWVHPSMLRRNSLPPRDNPDLQKLSSKMVYPLTSPQDGLSFIKVESLLETIELSDFNFSSTFCEFKKLVAVW